MKISNCSFLLLIIITLFACSNATTDQGNKASPENDPAVLQRLQQAVQLRPDSAGLRYLLMNELVRNNLTKQALQQNDTLLMSDSSNAGLWYRRGEILLQTGDTTAGVTSLERSIAQAPLFAEPLLQLAAVYANRLQPSALTLADRVINATEEPRIASQAIFIKGLYYSNINNKPKALEQFDDCIKNDYTFMDAYVEKGLLLYDQQNYTQSLQVFERAMQVSNTFAEAYYQAGRCQEALGNKAEAVLYYQKTLGLEKHFTAARDALKRMGK